ncbi:MAG: hypothetical protein JNL83_35795 [Myxococcales bacterium]|nr:hypothetical protein [Myxococcales bacterium]
MNEMSQLTSILASSNDETATQLAAAIAHSTARAIGKGGVKQPASDYLANYELRHRSAVQRSFVTTGFGATLDALRRLGSAPVVGFAFQDDARTFMVFVNEAQTELVGCVAVAKAEKAP